MKIILIILNSILCISPSLAVDNTRQLLINFPDSVLAGEHSVGSTSAVIRSYLVLNAFSCIVESVSAAASAHRFVNVRLTISASASKMAVVHSGDVGIYYPNHHLDTIAGGGLKAAIDVIRNSNKQEGISFHNTFISLGSNKVIPIRITTEDFQNFIAEVQLNLMTDEFGISSSTSEDQIITRWRIQVDEDRISVRSSYSPHVSETSLHMFSEGGRNPVHFWIGNTQTTGSIELK